MGPHRSPGGGPGLRDWGNGDRARQYKSITTCLLGLRSKCLFPSRQTEMDRPGATPPHQARRDPVNTRGHRRDGVAGLERHRAPGDSVA